MAHEPTGLKVQATKQIPVHIQIEKLKLKTPDEKLKAHTNKN